jgi:predicted enzyme related to lactoylglutathione lyase
MTTRDTPFAPGTPCWVDLLSTDVERSLAFYGALFGWTANEPDPDPQFGGYVNLLSDGRPVAGLMPKTAEMAAMPDVWSTYISTDDIDASVAAIGAAGGLVLAGPMPVADLGSMAIAQDPAGASFGLWHPGTHIGFTKYNEPGSVTWDELHSKDFASATPFYASVFGWTLVPMSDNDAFRYTTAEVGGETVAGMMDSSSLLPADVPSHWAVYFNVEDVDDACTQATELGATVLRAPEDTPFGRLADLVDATGAAFKLHSTKLANPATD